MRDLQRAPVFEGRMAHAARSEIPQNALSVEDYLAAAERTVMDGVSRASAKIRKAETQGVAEGYRFGIQAAGSRQILPMLRSRSAHGYRAAHFSGEFRDGRSVGTDRVKLDFRGRDVRHQAIAIKPCAEVDRLLRRIAARGQIDDARTVDRHLVIHLVAVGITHRREAQNTVIDDDIAIVLENSRIVLQPKRTGTVFFQNSGVIVGAERTFAPDMAKHFMVAGNIDNDFRRALGEKHRLQG